MAHELSNVYSMRRNNLLLPHVVPREADKRQQYEAQIEDAIRPESWHNAIILSGKV